MARTERHSRGPLWLTRLSIVLKNKIQKPDRFMDPELKAVSLANIIILVITVMQSSFSISHQLSSITHVPIPSRISHS